ncbi:hypothetical protein JYT22_00960 [Endomicrobium sp. AH-315-J14]|nr:hypothetical protein [Endomicrobium sp. AH-315-J14]
MSQALVKVYSGLSLTEAEVREALPECVFSEPVKRDDLLADVEAGVNVVVILDGKFQQSLAVSPSEILDALRSGMRVYGASSMGALRAAELYPQGMVGVGRIYRWIRSEPYFRDDYLGQIFREFGSVRDASEPYVDVHFGLRGLCEAGAIDEEARAELDELYRDMHFTDRDLRALERAVAGKPVLEAAVRELATKCDQKRRDGLEALERVAQDLAQIRLNNAAIRDSQRAGRYFDIFEPSVELDVAVDL